MDNTVAQSSIRGSRSGATLVAQLRQTELFRDYQQAFESITGLPLVLREPGSFQTPLQGSKRMNPFCALMAGTNRSCAACLLFQQHLEEEAVATTKTLQCYAGLNESAVPVRVGQHLIAYLQTGQVHLRAPTKDRLAEISELMGVNDGRACVEVAALEQAYFNTPVIAVKQYEAILQLLTVFANHLATVAHKMVVAAEMIESPAINKARTYILAHHGEELSLGDAARAGNMSAFYFCKLFKKATGLTFTSYLAQVRVESVKRMLLNPDTHVSEAAYAAGFQSLSQFNRVFRRIVKESPSDYRDRIHGTRHLKSEHQPAPHAA